MSIYSIYKATNIVNEKVYIGYTSNFEARKKKHKKTSEKSTIRFYEAIRKYGWDNFEWEIIYQSRDMDHCKNVMENYFIQMYDSYKNGYNSTLGGDGFDSEINSYYAKIRWQNQEYADRLKESRKSMFSDEKFLQSLSKASKENWQKEEYVKKLKME